VSVVLAGVWEGSDVARLRVIVIANVASFLLGELFFSAIYGLRIEEDPDRCCRRTGRRRRALRLRELSEHYGGGGGAPEVSTRIFMRKSMKRECDDSLRP
jgi:hypothetical protein